MAGVRLALKKIAATAGASPSGQSVREPSQSRRKPLPTAWAPNEKCSVNKKSQRRRKGGREDNAHYANRERQAHKQDHDKTRERSVISKQRCHPALYTHTSELRRH